MRLVLVIGLIALVSVVGSAVTTDTIVITVTPVYNLSVNIVENTTYFGTIEVGSSKTVRAGNIWNDGNITTNWEKQVSSPSSGGWALDIDGHPGEDEFCLLAISTVTTAKPDVINTVDNSIMDLGSLTDHYCRPSDEWNDLTEGAGSTASGTYVQNTTRDLWISIMLPTNVTASGSQEITLSVRAVQP